MKESFTCVKDIAGIKDSMQVGSGTTLATLEKGNYVVTLEVKGDVRVRYKNTIYETPAQFPKELSDHLEKNGLVDTDDVKVINNNWAEIFIWERKGKSLEWTGISDVVDDMPFTEETARKDMEEYLEDYLKAH